jgi:hypothetical protein
MAVASNSYTHTTWVRFWGVNSHSSHLRIFSIQRILLHGGNTMIKWNSNLPPDEASSNPHCFCIADEPSTILSSPTLLSRQFVSTLSGKYTRIIASSQQNHLGCAVRLCRFVAIGRLRSVAVICFVSNSNDDKLRPSMRRV